MRHKYATRGLVLARIPAGEASAILTLLTADLGLVRARAQSVRASGAKLASALVTFAESGVMLVRGAEGWRLVGAVPGTNWFTQLPAPEARERAARITGLLLRLAAHETREAALFPIMTGFLAALHALPEEQHEAVEILAALRLLAALGFETGGEGGPETFRSERLAEIARERAAYVMRVNAGIAASGL